MKEHGFGPCARASFLAGEFRTELADIRGCHQGFRLPHPDGAGSNPLLSEIHEFAEVLSGIEENKREPKRRFECSHRKWTRQAKIEPID